LFELKLEMLLLIDHLRDVGATVTEPKVQALVETSTEVLTGLVHAFDDSRSLNVSASLTAS